MTERLTEQQELFCQEYMAQGVVFGNASAAYRLAFGVGEKKPSTIHHKAYELLHTPKIQARIQELRNEMAARLKIKGEDLLQQWVLLASADANEIVRYQKKCCRYCYGINHQRQWSEHEFAIANAKLAQEKKKLMTTPAGGFGYNPTRDPHPKCPTCFGQGVENIFIADTGKLTGGARLLYNGIEKKRSGIKILLRNRDEALQNIARYLGLFGEKPKDASDSSEKLVKLSSLTNDPIEASKIYQKLISGN